jgi:hypothetical protein
MKIRSSKGLLNGLGLGFERYLVTESLQLTDQPPRQLSWNHADPCSCMLPYVAESAYLSRFPCWQLPAVSRYCALSGVKRYGYHCCSGEIRFAPSAKAYTRRTRLLRGWVNRAYADASDLGRWHHVLGGKGCLLGA